MAGSSGIHVFLLQPRSKTWMPAQASYELRKLEPA